MKNNIHKLAIIIGSMKSGTTYLFDHLSKHPKIAHSFPKEPAFFAHNYNKGLDWYISLFGFDTAKHSIALEASTAYTKHSLAETIKVTERIFEIQIPIKLIYIVRDPIERIESHYNYGISEGFGRGKNILSGEFITCSKYSMQLEPYIDRFGKENILLVDFEDIKKDIQGTSKNIFKFLEIETCMPFEDTPNKKSNSKNATIGRITESNLLFSLKKKLHYLRGTYRSILSHSIRRRINLLMSYRYRSIKKMTSVEKKKFIEIISSDIKILEEEHNFDVKHWESYSWIQKTLGDSALDC